MHTWGEFCAELTEFIHKELRTSIANLDDMMLKSMKADPVANMAWIQHDDPSQSWRGTWNFLHNWMACFMNGRYAEAYAGKGFQCNPRWYIDLLTYNKEKSHD